MFGTYRLVLAIFVVVTHIGHVEVIAGLAVWAFFMLSGFLITGVLNTKYGFNVSGLSGFAFSRILRLYPTYWVIVLFGFFITTNYRVEIDPALVNSAFQPLTDFREWFSGLFIMGHTIAGLGRVDRAFVPPIWAVDVELCMYVISCVIVSRTRSAARMTFLVCFCLFPLLWLGTKILINMGEINIGVQLIYSFLPAALLPYSIGSFLWFIRDELVKVNPSKVSLAFGMVSAVVFSLFLCRFSVTITYIISLCYFGYMTIALSKLKMSPSMKRLDDLLGHMSYPMYLSHYLCAYVVIVVSARLGILEHIAIQDKNDMYLFNIMGFFIVTMVTSMFSLLIAMLLEQPFNKIRQIVVRNLIFRN